MISLIQILDIKQCTGSETDQRSPCPFPTGYVCMSNCNVILFALIIRVRVQNVPIPLMYPREADEGLWAGEGIISGFKKKDDKHLKPR